MSDAELLQTIAAAQRAPAEDYLLWAEADAARLHLDRLPTEEEIRSILDPMISAGEEMALVDFTYWEAAHRRLHLEPKRSELGDEPELDYKGLKIRRSAVS